MFATALTTAAAQNPPALRATAESRISGDDQLLVPFNTLLVGPDGRIVVPQNQDGQLVFFDANGKRLGTFGHKGAGPGEFSLLDGTMGWRGGTLRVYDVNNGRRLTRIDSGHVAMHSRSTAARSFRTRTPTAGKRR